MQRHLLQGAALAAKRVGRAPVFLHSLLGEVWGSTTCRGICSCGAPQSNNACTQSAGTRASPAAGTVCSVITVTVWSALLLFHASSLSQNEGNVHWCQVNKRPSCPGNSREHSEPRPKSLTIHLTDGFRGPRLILFSVFFFGEFS